MGIRLRYIAPNGEWLPGVPASDHEVEDVSLADDLIASGLYEREAATVPRNKPAAPQAEASED